MNNNNDKICDTSKIIDKLIADDTEEKISVIKAWRKKFWDKFISTPSDNKSIMKCLKAIGIKQKSNHVSITKNDFIEYILPEAKHSYIVFVDGKIDLTLSDITNISSGVKILDYEKAFLSYGMFLQKRWSYNLEQKNATGAFLNGAFLHSKGGMVMVAEDTNTTSPLQVLHVITGNTAIVAPRLDLYVGTSSNITMFTSTCMLTKAGVYFNAMLDAIVEDGAALNYTSNITLTDNSFVNDTIRSTLRNNSVFNIINFSCDANDSSIDYKNILMGEGSKAYFNGAKILYNEAKCFSNISIESKNKNCTAHQLFKSVVDDNGVCEFEGTVVVDKKAKNTVSRQVNNNLLISKNAKAISQPILSIYVDEVEASHGATTSYIDEDMILYCLARGITKETAENIIIEGYVRKVIDLVEVQSLRESMMASILSYFERKSNG
jgi:Fe-S cluster assembly protein SufD